VHVEREASACGFLELAHAISQARPDQGPAGIVESVKAAKDQSRRSPGSSPQQMLLSVHGRLLTLPDNTVVHPGHGRNTTIGAERIGNPCLKIR
jgi:hypothetical protein